MNPDNLKSMSVDKLWSLHELIVSVLARKISAEQAVLEQKLRELGQNTPASSKKVSHHARRPYPQVFPKYRNPVRSSETWSGRGKQPRWLTAELGSGKKLDDFRIVRPMSIRRATTRKVVATKTKGRPRRSA
jgi:DNA-binding protein H-NS